MDRNINQYCPERNPIRREKQNPPLLEKGTGKGKQASLEFMSRAGVVEVLIKATKYGAVFS